MESNNVLLSVIIPTASRPELCLATLKSIFAANSQKELVQKIIIIENGIKTSLEIDLKLINDSRIIYKFQNNGNKSAALNTAIDLIKNNDFIVFLDDDIEVAPKIFEAYSMAAKSYPRDSYFGGPTQAIFETEPSRVFFQHLPASAIGFSCPLQFGEVLDKYLLGFNWAAFKDDILKAGGFNELYGPGAWTRATGQETQMQVELNKLGIVGRYVPDGLVFHHVPPEVFRWSWIVKRRYRSGIEKGLRYSREFIRNELRNLNPLRAIASVIMGYIKSDQPRVLGASVRISLSLGLLRGLWLKRHLKKLPEN